MYEDRFSAWQPWANRNELKDLGYPGVYVVALSHAALSGQPFSWRAEVIYVGMTNAVAGLKGRLQQFDNTIAGKSGHGGADRVRYKHRDYATLSQQLYVAVAPFDCDVSSGKPNDLLVMGKVACFEYECFAHYAEVFRRLPEFNDKKAAKKYSLTVGRGSDKTKTK